jgi:small subunit ribosomal protein S18
MHCHWPAQIYLLYCQIVTPKELTPAKCANVYRKPRFPRTPPPAPVARYNDMFRQLSMDPLDFSLNPSVLSNYISEMGKIYSRNVTGLTSRSQRRLGKAIRRARMIGVLPQLSRPSAGWLASHMKRSNS